MATQLLGNTTSTVAKMRRDARRRRYQLRDAAAKLLPERRVSWCGHKIVAGDTVDIRHNSNGAYYHNLATCGEVWTCPVCASRILAERRGNLAEAVANWSGSILMLTLTLQHSQDDKLGELLDAVKDAWRRMLGSRWWREMREDFELAAYITSTEVTYGAVNGWHPHLHILLFSDIKPSDFDRCRFKNELTAQYIAVLARKKRYASEFYGLSVVSGDDKAGNYVVKYGLEYEMASPETKKSDGGYTPLQLLEMYANGDTRAGALYREYAETLSGSKKLTYSKSAHKVLGIGKQREDEEIAAADDVATTDDDILLLRLTYAQYKRILQAGKHIDVLEHADSGDSWRVWQYLQDECGIIPEYWQVDSMMPLEAVFT